MAASDARRQSAFSKGRAILTSPPMLALLLVAAVVIGYHKTFQYLFGLHVPADQLVNPFSYWNIAAANYLNSGFIRRGLASTIFALLNHGSATLVSHIFGLVCAAWLLVPLSLIIARVHKHNRDLAFWLAFVLLVSPSLLRFWGTDIPLFDTLTCGFTAWALLATLSRRYLLAAAVLLVGSLSHETALIMGAPLCAAFWFLDWRDKQASLGQGAGAFGFVVVGVIAIGVLERLFGADLPTIARTIANARTTDHAAWLTLGPVNMQLAAAYILGGGLRTIPASFCQMYSYPGSYLFQLSCVVSLAFYIVIFGLRSWRALLVFAFVSLLPMVFLSIVAIDYGRWLAFAIMSAWLATAGMAIRGWAPGPSSYARYAVGLLAILLLAGLGVTNIPSSGYKVWQMTLKIYGPDRGGFYLNTCDPQWFRVAHGEAPK